MAGGKFKDYILFDNCIKRLGLKLFFIRVKYQIRKNVRSYDQIISNLFYTEFGKIFKKCKLNFRF